MGKRELHMALDTDGPGSPWVYTEDVDRLKSWLDTGRADLALDWIVKKVKPLIENGSKYWEGRLIFQGNVELDAYTGKMIVGRHDTADTIDVGIRQIVDILGKVLAHTTMRDFLVALGDPAKMPKPRCFITIDAVYCFAVSIGVYFEKVYTKEEVSHGRRRVLQQEQE